MDARTNLKSRLPSRHVTEGPERAPHRSYLYAMGLTSAQIHQPLAASAPRAHIANSIGLAGCDKPLSSIAAVFKRPPCIPDLKPGSRYVAKDIAEVGGIPLLMKKLLDNGYLYGDCMTVTGRSIAENLKSVKWNPNQDVVRPADKPSTVTGGVAGLKGNLASEGAIARIAGRTTLKFTGPGYLWKYAQQVGPAVYGAVTHPGGAAEKQSYADA